MTFLLGFLALVLGRRADGMESIPSSASFPTLAGVRVMTWPLFGLSGIECVLASCDLEATLYVVAQPLVYLLLYV
jgi:hypothetical protein